MKKSDYVMAIAFVIAIVLLLMIVLPVLKEEVDEKSEKKASMEPQIISSSQLVFNLKYHQYLEPYPYAYTYNGETRSFDFREMIRLAQVAAGEQEKGRLTYISNYKDGNGKAPLYRGKSVDGDGTLRGAAAPAYLDLEQMDEFDYLPDGTLVRILEEGVSEFVKVYSLKEKKEYFVPKKYVELGRTLEAVKKVIVVDLKNQTIAALENRPNKTYYKEANKILKTEWEIVSYSKCTTGKLGTYHQPTPEGFFYAIEKKPFFYYLKDGTNIVGGSEPWGIRFTAGAYVHGMSLGEYSSAIGTVPLSHKCVRNYTSHAKFLYDWYEEDRTIIIVMKGSE